jgi:nucleotide-binding universal stress UspA family protein
MTGVVLAILDWPEAAPVLLRAAARLADLLGGAAVHALIIRTPPYATIVPSEEILTKQHEDRIRAHEQARATALTEIFRDWMRCTDRDAHLSDVEGVATEAVAARGSAADFLVIGQPVRRQYGTGRQAIHAALFETDRPVLVVPPVAGDGFGRRVALAWRDDNRTIRAVLAAMRCFTQLAHLFVLAGQRRGEPPPHLPDILVEHSVVAELYILPVGPRRFAETLLQAAHACGADMLVVGAFVHDPVHRLILGGITRYMLAHADLPLLMRH